MKSKFFNVLAISLILIIVFSNFAIALDGDKEIEPKTTYISSHSESIVQGVLSSKVTATIYGNSSVTQVKIKMELQKLSSGSYSTIETWSQTFTGRSGALQESKATNPLSTYRLKVTFTAYTSSTSETRTVYAYDS